MNLQAEANISKTIQWACNVQLDLIEHYESLHGFGSMLEVRSNFKKRLKNHFTTEVELGLDPYLAESLYQFLTLHPNAYHIEMASDEMISVFLEFLKNK